MISIIVPVYNVELYIKECIDSIISQTYKNFELLLIDDGSTDSSYNICKEYEESDNRVKVFKKKNGGVSSARNFGIELASGKWIAFIDSDDYIGKNYLMELIQAELNFYDLSLVSGFIKQNKVKLFFKNTPIRNMPVEKAIESICGENGLCLAPWGKLFKREILIKYNIRFCNGLSFCEDLIFCFQYFKYINSVFISNDSSYFYREVNNSLTHKLVNHKQVLTALELQLSEFIYYKSKFPQNNIINRHFVNILTNCILRIGEQIFFDDNTSEATKRIVIKKCKECLCCISKYSHLIKLPLMQNIKIYIIKNLPYKTIKYFYRIK